MCYLSFSLFRVRLWLLFQCMDALEYDAMESVTSIHFRHNFFVFFLQQRIFHMMLLIAAKHRALHTHTRTFVKEYYLFAHYFEMHPHFHNVSKRKKIIQDEWHPVQFQSQKDIQLKSSLHYVYSLMFCCMRIITASERPVLESTTSTSSIHFIFVLILHSTNLYWCRICIKFRHRRSASQTLNKSIQAKIVCQHWQYC